MHRSNAFTRALRTLVTTLGCVAALGACTRWYEQPAPLPSVRRTLDGPVRVTRRDGSAVVLDGVDERGDSVIGVSKSEKRRVSIPAAEVARVQQKRPNVLATLALVTLSAAAAFVGYAMHVMSDPNY